jgi:hypothetical protein
MRRHVSESAISRLVLAASTAGALAVAGCIGTPTSAIERMENAVRKGEMAIDDPFVIVDTVGAIDIEVGSFGGNVRIEAVPGMTGTIVEPVRRAFLGHLRRDEADLSLGQIDYRIELRKGELDREILVISSFTTHSEPHYQGVDFMIRTGEVGRVDVVTHRGHVWIENNREGVDVETSYGDIRVVTDYPMNEAVTLLTKEGSVDYRVAPGSTGLYDLRTMGGDVHQRFAEARVTALGIENGPSTFYGEVGDGDNPVTIRTTYADIRVSVVENPTDCGPIISE